MNKYSSYFTRNKHKPISYHLNTAKRQFSYNWSKYRAHRGISISDKHLQSSFAIPLASNEMIAGHFRARQTPRFFIEPKKKEEYINAIKTLFPKKIDHTIQEADQVCNHIFNLLGSGPTDLSSKIDWHCDFKSGYQWPRVYYKEIKYKDYDKGYDIKVPRELSRFQHFTTLGKAYWYTNDERYTQEFVSQIEDWIRENPPEIGVNWQCTMDAAIRIVNWIWGFYFFKDSKSITNEFIIRFLKSCLVHGRHIRNNLEWREHVTSNHYISDLVGQVFLGWVFPEFKESQEWLSFGTEELLKELQKQVYDDGMDYEASTSYHRLVLELYYTAALLNRLNGYEWPQWAWDKINKMFKFVQGIIKPNCKIPQIGDNDSGRLQILENQDGLSQTYLFPIASVLFNDPSFKLKGIAFSEEALWLLGPNAYRVYLEMPESTTIDNLPSCHFKNGGLYVIRAKDNYCIISCGPNGQNGHGGHAHNDKLSFELNIKGEDIIVDPGTYLYTGDYRMRNLFRSTRYHNTIMIDKKEINDFDAIRLFQLRDSSNAKVVCFEKENSRHKFVGEHSGYCNSNYPVLHRRSIVLDEINQCWGISDSLTGADRFSHLFEQYFHFASHYNLKKITKKIHEHRKLKNVLSTDDKFSFNKDKWHTYSAEASELLLSISISSNTTIDTRIEEGWTSKAYGVKENAPILVISCSAPCPVYLFTFITYN